MPDPSVVASPVRRTAAPRTSTDGRGTGDGDVVARAARVGGGVALVGGAVGASGPGVVARTLVLVFLDAALVADREVLAGADVTPPARAAVDGGAACVAGIAPVEGTGAGWVVRVVGDGAGSVVRGTVGRGWPAGPGPVAGPGSCPG
jgi:hypothetical protein